MRAVICLLKCLGPRSCSTSNLLRNGEPWNLSSNLAHVNSSGWWSILLHFASTIWAPWEPTCVWGRALQQVKQDGHRFLYWRDSGFCFVLFLSPTVVVSGTSGGHLVVLSFSGICAGRFWVSYAPQSLASSLELPTPWASHTTRWGVSCWPVPARYPAFQHLPSHCGPALAQVSPENFPTTRWASITLFQWELNPSLGRGCILHFKLVLSLDILPHFLGIL